MIFGLFQAGPVRAQNVSRVESVLVKERAGDYQLIPPPPDARTQPSTVPAPVSGPFSVEAGTTLLSGGEDGTVLVLDTTGAAKMQADSAIKVPSANGATHSLEQLEGTLFFKMDAEELKKAQKSEFRLKTPTALLAVKGTQFFAHCSGGTDRIGVHEGVVMVHEPVSRQTITLTAGNAVEVQQGTIGEQRPMTADELGEQDNYTGLEVAHVRLQPFRDGGPPPPAESQAVIWGKLLLRDATTPPGQEALQDRDPEVTSNGALRLAWPGLPPVKEPVVLWSSGRIALSNLPQLASMKPMALSGSVRVSGCSEMVLGLAKTDNSEALTGQEVRQTSWPANGGWASFLIDVPDGATELQLGIRATPDVSQQMRTPGRMFNVGSIEIKDITLLLGPNDSSN